MPASAPLLLGNTIGFIPFSLPSLLDLRSSIVLWKLCTVSVPTLTDAEHVGIGSPIPHAWDRGKIPILSLSAPVAATSSGDRRG